MLGYIDRTNPEADLKDITHVHRPEKLPNGGTGGVFGRIRASVMIEMARVLKRVNSMW